MAEAAGHAHPVGLDEALRLVIAWVGVVSNRVPLPFSGLVESGIREQAHTHDAGSVSIVRSSRDILAACANLDAGVLRFVFKRIFWAIALALVEPEAIPLGVGLGGLVEARFIDE